MAIKVLNEFLPVAETENLGAIKVGDTLEIETETLNVDASGLLSCYYSNCITEVPQDIKLELKNGLLTLKAGSKIYFPAGKENNNNIFTTNTTVEDITIHESDVSGQWFIMCGTNLSVDPQRIDTLSGNTFPENPLHTQKFYKADENLIYRYDEDLNDWQVIGLSVPLAIISFTEGTPTDIVQIFNGASYIGHHAFAFPGVKGLIPNGFNEKGNVSSLKATITSVQVMDLTGSTGLNTDYFQNVIGLRPDGTTQPPFAYIYRKYKSDLTHTEKCVQYVEETNLDYVWSPELSDYNMNNQRVPFVTVSLENSRVIDFIIEQPAHFATNKDRVDIQGTFLFDYKWADHNPNELSWLRADTFSWQDGDIYKAAYKHLLNDLYVSSPTSASETIAGITIYYWQCSDGHKICGTDQATNLQELYDTTGVAWYYIVDEPNKRFKLPRTKFMFTGLRDSVGRYVAPGLPNITGTVGPLDDASKNNLAGAFFNNGAIAYDASSTSSGNGWKLSFDASRISNIYGASSTVQPPATQMYLYCYVGYTDQIKLHEKEIDLDELANQKITQINTVTNTNLTSINAATEEGVTRLNTDSNALNRTQITNCITEVPQNIKLELISGVLTLKAGSKIYIPNGFEEDGTTPKFDIVITATDLIVSANPYNVLTTTMYDPINNDANARIYTNQCYSGSTPPTDLAAASLYYWYDTTNNIIKCKYGSGTEWTGKYSLPFATVMSTQSDGYSYISQVFNGFGYVGSLTYALPGVKGLIPNGRNADGTMNNLEYTTPSVLLRDWSAESYTGQVHYWLTSNNILSNTGVNYHISPAGYLIDDYNNNRISGFICADGYRTAGRITTFNIRQPITIPDTASNHYFYEWKGLTAVASVQNYTINFTCRRGNPIFMSLAGDANPIGGTGWADYRLLKNDILKTRIVTDCSGESKNMAFCLTYLDTDVIAGNTYTYTFRIRENGSGTINFQEGGDTEAPKIIMYEL